MAETQDNHPENTASRLAPHVLELGRLCISFARTDRLVHSDPEGTLESDTDHTFMLAMVSGAIAAEYLPELDHRKVIEFALIHDLPEVIAGDVATANISDEAYMAKQLREGQAIDQLGRQFDAVFPWITDTIRAYERLDTPEARFVKIMDKVMPSILHFNNDGFSLAFHEIDSLDGIENSTADTTRRIADHAHDQQFALQLRQEFIDMIKRRLFDESGRLIQGQ